LLKLIGKFIKGPLWLEWEQRSDVE
jgi:hypothetical protein